MNTRNMLRRRHYNIGNDFNCMLCSQQVEEYIDHLIFHCPLCTICWLKLENWGLQSSRHALLEYSHDMWTKPMFMEVFLQASWSIWNERNNKLFRRIPPTHTYWLEIFKKDFGLLEYIVQEENKAFIHALVHSL
jgi:hypothetical protein